MFVEAPAPDPDIKIWEICALKPGALYAAFPATFVTELNSRRPASIFHFHLAKRRRLHGHVARLPASDSFLS